ncbi:SusD/RagB family nutrient-binding outer membrane lipoprotein [Massilibacteroides vaginae]|uniref:SusD/RagB family nutrient-binding outer membrane lipoprotein n=1 Tax=Massilibacteroides vaginae TaxID=1673718 RepID=UPI000A1C7F84|nr:SusD/RagB family nutrient-binding outer membrane lipoprotein [Massilibacteroides vaginae]
MKRNSIYIIITGILLTVSISGCDNFEEYNTNPDESTKVTSGMLASNLILGVMKEQSTTKTFVRDDMLSKYIAWTEGNDIDYAFNKLGRLNDYREFSDRNMVMLNNVQRMIDFATNEKLKNSYTALGHFIRASKFFYLTMRVGDVPYSEAFQGDNDNYNPKYDTQKEVFLGLLKELDKADELFQNGDNFDGDPVYNGDITQWRKAVNVLQLKLLINLYKKANDSDLQIKERFQAIVNSRPIFKSNADNCQLIHSDRANEKYPFYKEGNNFIVFNQVSSIVIDTLKLFEDRRLFYYAKPTPKANESGMNQADWDAYNGVDPTLTFAEIQKKVEEKNVSQLNNRYTQIPEGEPTFLLSYAEMNLILAEAAARGFINGNAQAYYEEGIRASMKFVADNTPDEPDFHHNMKISDDYITSYLQGKEVAFASTFARQLRQIIMQKYLTTFLQTAFNGYYEYRRTGIPAFPINPSSNRNDPADKMPLRWMYSSQEYTYNTDNVNEAVARQFGGTDTENGVMWILQD